MRAEWASTAPERAPAACCESPVEGQQTNCEPQASDLLLRQPETECEQPRTHSKPFANVQCEACPHVPGWGVLWVAKPGRRAAPAEWRGILIFGRAYSVLLPLQG